MCTDHVSVAVVSQSRGVCYADLILDQSSGIVLRPLSLLGNDVGLKTLVSLTTALSLQYEKCWIMLYAQDEKRCADWAWNPAWVWILFC